MRKKALITGITGQDGSYLVEFLFSNGYEVRGIIRRGSTFNTSRIDHIYVDPHKPEARVFLHYGDLSDSEQISNVIYNIKPDEVYHLGAQSHVRVSFDTPEYTEFMYEMLQNNKPEDLVIGTGETHSVKEFVKEAFSYTGLDWKKYVKIDRRYFRPTEVKALIADSTKAKKVFGRQPKIKFRELVRIMIDADMRKTGLKPIGEGD